MACIKPGSQLDRDRQKWEAHLVAQGVPATEAAARAESMAVNSRVAALKKKRQQLWLDTKARVDIEAAMKASSGDMGDGLLDVIERALTLYTNKGDTVYSPFMGIGSEGYQSLRMGRKFIGTELKQAYYRRAVKNLTQAEAEGPSASLFGEAA